MTAKIVKCGECLFCSLLLWLHEQCRHHWSECFRLSLRNSSTLILCSTLCLSPRLTGARSKFVLFSLSARLLGRKIIINFKWAPYKRVQRGAGAEFGGGGDQANQNWHVSIDLQDGSSIASEVALHSHESKYAEGACFRCENQWKACR